MIFDSFSDYIGGYLSQNFRKLTTSSHAERNPVRLEFKKTSQHIPVLEETTYNGFSLPFQR